MYICIYMYICMYICVCVWVEQVCQGYFSLISVTQPFVSGRHCSFVCTNILRIMEVSLNMAVLVRRLYCQVVTFIQIDQDQY